MTIHIVKLCVGVDRIQHLREWQDSRYTLNGEIAHITRMMPKRKEELCKDGSFYWVIGGYITVRQKIINLKDVIGRDGVKRCKIILSPDLFAVRPTARRAFQGWRYLKQEDAPPDIGPINHCDNHDAIPPKLRRILTELALL